MGRNFYVPESKPQKKLTDGLPSIAKPLPGKEERMKQNKAGGYVFESDAFTNALMRLFTGGTITESYYQDSTAIAREGFEAYQKLVRGLEQLAKVLRIPREEALAKFVDLLKYADPNALRFSAILQFAAYALDSRFIDRAHAMPHEVLRELSNWLVSRINLAQLYELLYYHRALTEPYKAKGHGMVHTKAVKYIICQWFERLVKQCAKKYETREAWANCVLQQILKYQNRSGFSFWDAILIGHPKLPEYLWEDIKGIHGGVTENRDGILVPKKFHAPLANAYAQLVALAAQYERYPREREHITRKAVQIVRKHKLTREFVPPTLRETPVVMSALIDTMPPLALIKAVPELASKGMLDPDTESYQRFVNRLTEVANKIHPFDFLLAYIRYNAGRTAEGRRSWTTYFEVSDMLETYAQNALLHYMESDNPFIRNKKPLNVAVIIDTSGSMEDGLTVMNLETDGLTLASILGLTIIYATRGSARLAIFSNYAEELASNTKEFTKYNLSEFIQHLRNKGTFRGTNLSSVFDLYQDTRLDLMIILTDVETWEGAHPDEALKRHRLRTGWETRAVIVNVVPTSSGSPFDPLDPHAFHFNGFDASIMRKIELVAQDAFDPKYMLEKLFPPEHYPDVKYALKPIVTLKK